MCTSTTLLMLSKWMSQTCSMISDRVTGRSLLRIRNSSSAYSFGFRSIAAPGASNRAPDGVHLQVGDAQHALTRRAAPQQRAQSRRQLRERERLDHVVVGAAHRARRRARRANPSRSG